MAGLWRVSRRETQGPARSSASGQLPETLEGWDRKLHCFRDLVAALERSDRRSRYEQTGLLPRYRQVLAIAPVNADDLEKILSIKAEFFWALPSIRALCEHSLLENV